MPFQKETLQEHTEHLFIFCLLVWILKPNQSIFSISLREVAKKRQNLGSFALSTTLR